MVVRFVEKDECDFGSLGKWPRVALKNKEIQELITSRYDAQMKGLEQAIEAIEKKRVAFMTVADIGTALINIAVKEQKKTALIRNFERYLMEV